MAPSGKHRGPAERVEARNVLQAILLADSFTQRFRPITVQSPKVLLPLVNVPMIEYTLEWLATNKVQEVFVFCCAHADQIKQYLASSKWAKNKDMIVSTVVSTSCLSVGEALRVIHQKDVIHNDFVLVSGDTVSNLNLGPILDAHRGRRAVDKQAIFTMVMKATQHPHQRLRLGDTETVVCVDASNKRLLKFYEPDSLSRRPASLKIDAAFFSERDTVQVRTDLMDTHISVCAPEVLMLFTDNFDFANLKRDFIPGVLSEEELGSKLYIHEMDQSEYAAHIHNLRSYDAVSRDVMQRWCFPMVPDTNILYKGGPWGVSTYIYSRGHRYYEQQVSIHRTAQMGEDVCVGAGTSIGEESRISQSIIGRNCRIGKGVHMVGCYVQDGTTIQDGVVMRHALVCENVMVQSGAVLSPGSVLSYNVVIGAKHVVPANTRISLCRQQHQTGSLSDDELEYAGAANSSGGAKAVATARRLGDDSDDDDDDDDSDDEGYSEDPLGQSLEKPTDEAIKLAEALAIGKALAAEAQAAAQFDAGVVGSGGAGYSWVPSETSDMDRQLISPPNIVDSSGGDEEGEAEEAAATSTRGAARGDEDEDDGSEGPDSAEVTFKREVAETFLRCIKLKNDQAKANALIELNGLKIAEDKTFADLARYIFTTLLSMCLPAPSWVSSEFVSLFPARGTPTPAPAALVAGFVKLLRSYKDMLKKCLRDDDDQVEMLLTFEDYCSEEGVFAGQDEHGAAFSDIFGKILYVLYDEEVLSEEAVEAWAEAKEEDAEEDQQYLKKAAGFLEWLRTAEEDDDDEDDDDEEEDD